MIIIKQFVLLWLLSLSETNFIQNLAAKTIEPINTTSFSKPSIRKIVNRSFSTTVSVKDNAFEPAPENIDDSGTTADEIKNKVPVNDLLNKANDTAVISTPELHQGPHYELNWAFIDKETIRVTFDLFSVPTALIENNIYSASSNERQSNILATMISMPSRFLKTIFALEYFLFIIRPYNNNREIVLKLEKVHTKNTTTRPYPHFSNTLRLTSLNPHEKYSVCICYYQKNGSTQTPDLLLCQDVINDYSKFGHLKTNVKHGLLFIMTQYSIIIGLLVVLQSVFTMRKRRFAHIIRHHLANTAHTFRSTLSSVSLVRHSFSSLDAAAEQQQQHTTGHTLHHEPTIKEGGKPTKRITSSPAIVISEPSMSVSDDVNSPDETEPFLKQIPSKNHVHFLIGPTEGSDEDENEHENNTTLTQREPYDDQADALLSMAHILDTNKPWSRHS